MQTFDSLAYFEQLKAAGMPEEQAKVQANAFRDFSAIQEANSRQELATKMDLRELELRLLKWQIGVALALADIMAKGFCWIGF